MPSNPITVIGITHIHSLQILVLFKILRIRILIFFLLGYQVAITSLKLFPLPISIMIANYSFFSIILAKLSLIILISLFYNFQFSYLYHQAFLNHVFSISLFSSNLHHLTVDTATPAPKSFHYLSDCCPNYHSDL